jgi:hypothetical protein
VELKKWEQSSPKHPLCKLKLSPPSISFVSLLGQIVIYFMSHIWYILVGEYMISDGTMHYTYTLAKVIKQGC